MENKNNVKCSFIVTILAMITVVFSIAANTVSARLGFFGPYAAPMGVFFFPFIYIISDILSEVYGYRISRWVSWIATFVNLLFIGLVLGICTLIKPADIPFVMELNNSIFTVFSTSVRVIVGSIIGAILAGWANDIIFQALKHKDGEKGFAKRKLLSSLAAESIDTVLFITIAFVGTMPFSAIIPMYIIQFILKYTVEVLTEPVAHFLSAKLKKYDPDAFEDRNNFNIFGFVKKTA